jgi:hypothetical protein
MGHNPVTVDCALFRQPDLATVDALLRLRLMLKRAGEDVVLENTGPRLRELISLVGVEQALEGARQSRRGGRPKRGNRRSVSRKNVSSLMRPPSSSSTCSAHGS